MPNDNLICLQEQLQSQQFLLRYHCSLLKVYFLPFRRALTPPGLGRDDWKIIRALSEVFVHFYIFFLYPKGG